MRKPTFAVVLEPFPFEELCETAALAEDIGYDYFLIGDHLMWYTPEPKLLNCWAILTALALKTTSINLGTCVTSPGKLHPAVLAQMVVSIDYMSNGRMQPLGIGIGGRGHIFPFGITQKKIYTKTRELIEVMKSLWTGEKVDYDGNIFKLRQAYLPAARLMVQKPHPPIWMTGAGPISRRLVAQVADGWIGTRQSVDMYREDLKEVRTVMGEFGRRTEELTPAYYYRTAVSKDYDTALKLMEESSKSFYLSALEKERLGPECVVGPSTVMPGRFVASLEAMKRLCPFGTTDDIVDALERYVEVGVRSFLIMPIGSFEERKNALRLYAEEVIPRLKGLE